MSPLSALSDLKTKRRRVYSTVQRRDSVTHPHTHTLAHTHDHDRPHDVILPYKACPVKPSAHADLITVIITRIATRPRQQACQKAAPAVPRTKSLSDSLQDLHAISPSARHPSTQHRQRRFIAVCRQWWLMAVFLFDISALTSRHSSPAAHFRPRVRKPALTHPSPPRCPLAQP